MPSTKRLQKAAQRFRKTEPWLYERLAFRCHRLANMIRLYGSSDKQC